MQWIPGGRRLEETTRGDRLPDQRDRPGEPGPAVRVRDPDDRPARTLEHGVPLRVPGDLHGVVMAGALVLHRDPPPAVPEIRGGRVPGGVGRVPQLDLQLGLRQAGVQQGQAERERAFADQLAQVFTVYPSMSGSVAEAARRLGLTHGAVAQQIRKLEQELGVALVDAATLLDLYGEDIRARAYVTQDPIRGEVMLRPDFTVPVVQMHMENGAEPARYCYLGEVFRKQDHGDTRPEHPRDNEYLQAGFELFARDADADAQARALANDWLNRHGR